MSSVGGSTLLDVPNGFCESSVTSPFHSFTSSQQGRGPFGALSGKGVGPGGLSSRTVHPSPDPHRDLRLARYKEGRIVIPYPGVGWEFRVGSRGRRTGSTVASVGVVLEVVRSRESGVERTGRVEKVRRRVGVVRRTDTVGGPTCRTVGDSSRQ